MTQAVERRNFRRYPIIARVEQKKFGTKSIFSVQTRDISQGGCFIESDRMPEVGTRVVLTFALLGIPNRFSLTGDVKRHGIRDGKFGFGVGWTDSKDNTDGLSRLQQIVDAVDKPQPVDSPRELNILLADDDHAIRSLITEGLDRLRSRNPAIDLNIVECADGVKTRVAMLKNRFDLILLDINMPVIDGTTILREFRSIAGNADVPVVVISADDQAAIDSVVRNYADILIEKPARMKDLLFTIETLLPLQRAD